MCTSKRILAMSQWPLGGRKKQRTCRDAPVIESGVVINRKAKENSTNTLDLPVLSVSLVTACKFVPELTLPVVTLPDPPESVAKYDW